MIAVTPKDKAKRRALIVRRQLALAGRRGWTPGRRAAQAQRIRDYWTRRRAADGVEAIDHSETPDVEAEWTSVEIRGVDYTRG